MTLFLLALSFSTLAGVVGLVCTSGDAPGWCKKPVYTTVYTSPNPLNNTRGVEVTWDYQSELLYQEGF